jgi:RNase H-like domain found in reverse transcriptase
MNLDAGEQKLLALMYALTECRCYLEGVDLTLVTDHRPNTFFEPQSSLPQAVQSACMSICLSILSACVFYLFVYPVVLACFVSLSVNPLACLVCKAASSACLSYLFG